MNVPLLSVVTPFRNTARYLAECIESVLAQSYTEFEYILSDNGSTDGSTEIAEEYARRDPRIRLIRQPRLLSQVQHYNRALAGISGASKYCKIVQADDSIFPECLRLMVQAFEQSESIGLVSAYDLKRNVVRGSGFPYPGSLFSGKEIVRAYLRTGLFVFGSPTTVMYRASLVREQEDFYEDELLHEDTEKCIQILECWDFGFVHQVLSFLRTENESISSSAYLFCPDNLDYYIVVKRYSGAFFDSGEAAALVRGAEQDYYRALARKTLKFPKKAFWSYHQKGLKTIGESIDWRCLTFQTALELVLILANPASTIARTFRFVQKRFGRERESALWPSPATQVASALKSEDRNRSVHI